MHSQRWSSLQNIWRLQIRFHGELYIHFVETLRESGKPTELECGGLYSVLLESIHTDLLGITLAVIAKNGYSAEFFFCIANANTIAKS